MQSYIILFIFISIGYYYLMLNFNIGNIIPSILAILQIIMLVYYNIFRFIQILKIYMIHLMIHINIDHMVNYY